MHPVQPRQFFQHLDDDALLSVRQSIEETLDWAERKCSRNGNIGLFWAWRINLAKTNAEITRRLWS